MDASVGAKWLLAEEEDRPAAVSLLDRYAAGDVDLVVPDLFFCEVSNALLLAVRRRRVSGEAALEALRELKDLHLMSVSVGPLLESALPLALRLSLSIYDAAYLAVAESQGVPLVTADTRLHKCGLEWVINLDSL